MELRIAPAYAENSFTKSDNGMDAIGAVLGGHAHPILLTFPRVVLCRHRSKVDAGVVNRNMDLIAGSENHRNGVDTSAN